ncbi:MAG: acetyl-CoA carboxylase carboxyltransferase subunit alpha [Planctomycetota bacterium]
MSVFYQLDFERPVRELEDRIAELRLALDRAEAGQETTASSPVAGATPPAVQIRAELDELTRSCHKQLGELYSKLRPWDVVRVARHPNRPQTRDYISMMCRDFVELHGDRRYGDDPAIVTGFARLGPYKVMVIGHQKGKDTAEKVACHFGCAHPEGYRKAMLKMELAAKHGVPIVTLVDTPGAYPGLGAEQRGQAEAIAVNLREMSRLPVPIVSVVIGEGGSGGALGIAVADRVGMLANSWYSVISPEGCAAILWKQANESTNASAAEALRLTASDNVELGIIDGVVPEPPGGAHRDPQATAVTLREWIVEQLADLVDRSADDLLDGRYERFRKLGRYLEEEPEPVPESEATDDEGKKP